MSSEIKDYNENIETLFIRFMISNADLFVRCRGILKADFFDDKTNRTVIELLMSHSEQYNAIPSLEQILAVTGKSFELLGDVAYKEDNWFLKEIEYFCKYKGLRDAILSSPELLDEGRYGEVEALIKAAVQIGLVKDLGLDYFNDPKARLESIKNSNGQIKTGWKDVDDKLYGGLNRGEITIFAGQCVVSSTKVLAVKVLDLAEYFSKR